MPLSSESAKEMDDANEMKEYFRWLKTGQPDWHQKAKFFELKRSKRGDSYP